MDIDQVDDEAPRLTPKMKQLMHITCHGKTIQSSLEVLCSMQQDIIHFLRP